MTSPGGYSGGSHAAAPTAGGNGLAGEVNLLERAIFEVKRIIVGQDQLVERILVGLLAKGHVLLEGVPGVAKTLAVETFAKVVGGTFSRIQFTPDLVPTDIIGTRIYRQGREEFDIELGPVVCNFLLADEINRAPAKVQSALLEVMAERKISIGGKSYPLPKPFLVMATQNPIEEEGTYVLPEAQMDRFLLKEVLTYPRPAHEMDILDRVSSGAFDRPLSTTAISPDDVLWLQRLVERVYVDPVVKQFIVALVNTTRCGGPRPIPGLDRHVRVGASPRGGIALMKVAQAIALQAGRTYVTPDDVKLLRHGVLRHRIVRTYDALADDVAPEALIDAVFAAVPTP